MDTAAGGSVEHRQDDSRTLVVLGLVPAAQSSTVLSAAGG